MTLLYETDAAKNKIKKYNLNDRILKLRTDCEQRDFKEAIKLFKIRYPYHYRREANYRLVATYKLIDEVPVICILDLMVRGSMEAERFNLDQREFGEDNFDINLDINDLKKYVAQKNKNRVREKHLSILPEDYRKWWETFTYANSNEIVMESENWIQSFESSQNKKYWASYFQIIKYILNNKDKFISQKDNIIQKWEDENGRGIFFAFLEPNISESKCSYAIILYLIDLFESYDPHADELEINIRNKYSWLNAMKENCDPDEIARHSRRAYPSFTAEDDGLWSEIEEEKSSNLALSGEESQLLYQLRNISSTEGVLPVFINGRAGSGKSTILYYLYSDYLFKKLLENPPGDLLFITYSEELLKLARTSVRKLISARPDLRLEQYTGSTNINPELIEWSNYFRSFLDFLLEIAQKSLLRVYDNDKFIDYRRFIQLFLGKNIPEELEPYRLQIPRKGLSPDTCWHVIRTFIKGYQSDENLSSEDYLEINSKERTIQPEIYKQIYQTIWKNWYQPLHEEYGFWDSQDLVRDLINAKLPEPKYSVIFCDEAQDFTRIEIEFILSLLVYRGYDLGWEKNIRLPFALAGDPFQTLNPTGFRWEAIKASFYDEVSSTLDPEVRGNIAIQYKELSYNYRSEVPIVRFSNLLQLWRQILFDTPEVDPQKPWKEKYIIPPRLYIINENISIEEMKELVKNSVVIIPCEKNQEEEFWSGDAELSKIKKSDIKFSVQSPIMAKGQEFPKVILYKFGEYCPRGFFDVKDEKNRLEKEYFLNKLYVGATRAIKSLIIVDTKTGYQKLWFKAAERKEIDSFVQKSKTPNLWNNLIEGITSGDYYRPSEEEQDPLETAELLRKAGKDGRNAELILQAKDFYFGCGKKLMVEICQAEIYEIQEQYKQAGDLYKKLGHYLDAERCYWKGKYWKDLDLYYKERKPSNHLYKIITQLMNSPSDLGTAYIFINDIFDSMKKEETILLSETQIQTAIQISFHLLVDKYKELNENSNKLLVDLMEIMPLIKRIVGLEDAGMAYYHCEIYNKALACWESSKNKDTKEYYIAKAFNEENLNEKISSLYSAKDYLHIVDLFIENPSFRFREDVIDKISISLIDQKRYEENIKFLLRQSQFEKVFNFINADTRDRTKKLSKEKSQEFIIQVFNGAIKDLTSDLAIDSLNLAHHLCSPEEILGLIKSYIYTISMTKNWKRAFSMVIPKDFQINGITRKSLSILDSLSIDQLSSLQKRFFEGMATYNPNLNNSEKSQLDDFINQFIKRGFHSWNAEIPLTLMCTMVERIQTTRNVLDFYENLMKESVQPYELIFLRNRWLKVKQKQIIYIKKEGELFDIHATQGSDETKTFQKSNYLRAAARNQKQLQNKAFDWKISIDSIDTEPEFPKYVFENNGDEQKQHFGNIDISFISPRCQILNKEDSNDVLIDLIDANIMPFGIKISQEKKGEVTEFSIPDWNINGSIYPGNKIILLIDGKEKIFEIEGKTNSDDAMK